MVIEIKNEVNQQKNYLQIMKDTLDSKCCKIYQEVYVENLGAPNWMYGNQTEKQYQANLEQELSQFDKDNTLIKTCPLSQPFPSNNFSQCTSCSDSSLHYNLQTRQCEQCSIGKIFNYNTRTCDFNVVCPAGTKFNEETVMCEKIQPSYNDSLCPP